MGRLIDADSVKEILYESEERITNNMSDAITSLIRENYIPKADYENRLKADMVAMLKELDLKVDELANHFADGKIVYRYQLHKLIQQKINELKAESEDNE